MRENRLHGYVWWNGNDGNADIAIGWANPLYVYVKCEYVNTGLSDLELLPMTTKTTRHKGNSSSFGTILQESLPMSQNGSPHLESICNRNKVTSSKGWHPYINSLYSPNHTVQPTEFPPADYLWLNIPASAVSYGQELYEGWNLFFPERHEWTGGFLCWYSSSIFTITEVEKYLSRLV